VSAKRIFGSAIPLARTPRAAVIDAPRLIQINGVVEMLR
jgi:hypothetical protein